MEKTGEEEEEGKDEKTEVGIFVYYGTNPYLHSTKQPYKRVLSRWMFLPVFPCQLLFQLRHSKTEATLGEQHPCGLSPTLLLLMLAALEERRKGCVAAHLCQLTHENCSEIGSKDIHSSNT